MPWIPIVLGLVAVAAAVAWAVLRRRAPTPPKDDFFQAFLAGAEKVQDTCTLADVELLAADPGTTWLQVYERLNPRNDPELKALLDDYRNRGLQFNPTRGVNVLLETCRSLAGSFGGPVPTKNLVAGAIRFLDAGNPLGL